MGGKPNRSRPSAVSSPVLGIEGGGTKTIALFADRQGTILQRREFAALNIKLLTDRELVHCLQLIRRHFIIHPSSISLCCAGCRTKADRKRLYDLATRVWPQS